MSSKVHNLRIRPKVLRKRKANGLAETSDSASPSEVRRSPRILAQPDEDAPSDGPPSKRRKLSEKGSGRGGRKGSVAGKDSAKKKPTRARGGDDPIICVVDKHHDAFRAIAEETKKSTLPKEGMRLLHFDSHPDLGAPHSSKLKTHIAPQRKRPRSGGLKFGSKSTPSSSYRITEVHRRLNIATWILPLVAAGHVDQVFWVAGPWCDQMSPGEHSMHVGFHKVTRRLRVAFDDNGLAAKRSKDTHTYYTNDGSLVPRSELECIRSFRLRVCLLNDKLELLDADRDAIAKTFGKGRGKGGKKWLLDIDEDFYSVSNPFYDEFVSMFSDDDKHVIDRLSKAKDLSRGTVEGFVRHVLNNKQHSIEQLMEAPEVQKMLSGAKPSERLSLLQKFHTLLWQIKRDPRESDDYTISNIWDETEVYDWVTSWDLPRHMSKFEEILSLMNLTANLLKSLRKPSFVTVATSRFDRYLPEAQATIIHTYVTRMLRRQYPKTSVRRWDVTKVSIEEVNGFFDGIPEESDPDSEVEMPPSPAAEEKEDAESPRPAKRARTRDSRSRRAASRSRKAAAKKKTPKRPSRRAAPKKVSPAPTAAAARSRSTSSKNAPARSRRRVPKKSPAAPARSRRRAPKEAPETPKRERDGTSVSSPPSNHRRGTRTRRAASLAAQPSSSSSSARSSRSRGRLSSPAALQSPAGTRQRRGVATRSRRASTGTPLSSLNSTRKRGTRSSSMPRGASSSSSTAAAAASSSSVPVVTSSSKRSQSASSAATLSEKAKSSSSSSPRRRRSRLASIDKNATDSSSSSLEPPSSPSSLSAVSKSAPLSPTRAKPSRNLAILSSSPKVSRSSIPSSTSSPSNTSIMPSSSSSSSRASSSSSSSSKASRTSSSAKESESSAKSKSFASKTPPRSGKASPSALRMSSSPRASKGPTTSSKTSAAASGPLARLRSPAKSALSPKSSKRTPSKKRSRTPMRSSARLAASSAKKHRRASLASPISEDASMASPATGAGSSGALSATNGGAFSAKKHRRASMAPPATEIDSNGAPSVTNGVHIATTANLSPVNVAPNATNGVSSTSSATVSATDGGLSATNGDASSSSSSNKTVAVNGTHASPPPRRFETERDESSAPSFTVATNGVSSVSSSTASATNGVAAATSSPAHAVNATNGRMSATNGALSATNGVGNGIANASSSPSKAALASSPLSSMRHAQSNGVQRMPPTMNSTFGENTSVGHTRKQRDPRPPSLSQTNGVAHAESGAHNGERVSEEGRQNSAGPLERALGAVAANSVDALSEGI